MTWYSLVKEIAVYATGAVAVAWLITWAFTIGVGEDDD